MSLPSAHLRLSELLRRDVASDPEITAEDRVHWTTTPYPRDASDCATSHQPEGSPRCRSGSVRTTNWTSLRSVTLMM